MLVHLIKSIYQIEISKQRRNKIKDGNFVIKSCL